MRASVELCHSPPRRFSQPVVHNQESPLVSYASCVCESDRPLLNSRHTQTRLTFPREEEEDRGEGPLPPESRILLNHEIGIYTDIHTLPLANVGLFQVQIFFRVSLKKVAFSSLALSQAAFFRFSTAVSGSSLINQLCCMAAPVFWSEFHGRAAAAGGRPARGGRRRRS